MKVFNKKSMVALALTGLLTLTCAGFMGSAATAEPIEAEESAVSIPENTAQTLASCTAGHGDTIIMPDVTPEDLVDHYCAATYAIKQNDPGADTVQFFIVPNDQFARGSYHLSYGETKRYVQLSTDTKDKVAPTYPYVRAYCTSCEKKSSFNNVMYYSNNMIKAPHTTVGTLTSGSIPTSYDQQGYIWTHGGSKGQSIAFTLAYNGVVKDGYVLIPSLGTKSTSIIIEGVTFYVRTGPNKVSIKASQSVTCNCYGTLFGFTVLAVGDL